MDMFFSAVSVFFIQFRLDGPTASQQFNRKDVKFDASGANRSYDVKIENFDIAFGDRYVMPLSDYDTVSHKLP